VANKFKDAIAGFNRFHSKKWLLQRQFQIEKPYKIVSSGVIAALPDYPPSSAAYVEMSPVGFNHEKLRPSFILAVLAVVLRQLAFPSAWKTSRQLERSTRRYLHIGIISVAKSP